MSSSIEAQKQSRPKSEPRISLTPEERARSERDAGKNPLKKKNIKPQAKRENFAIDPGLKGRLDRLRSFDALTQPSYQTKVDLIRIVLGEFGFSPLEREIILCQFHRESYNFRAKPPVELDQRVVAGGDNTGIAQIRPMTAHEMAQTLGLADMRGLLGMKTVQRKIKNKSGETREVEMQVVDTRKTIAYLKSHWATTVVLGVGYLAKLRWEVREHSKTQLSPTEEMRRVLVAYNTGPPRTWAAIAKEPHSWLQLLSGTTRSYVNDLMDPVYRARRLREARKRAGAA